MPVIRDDEPMQIELETILHRGAVDLGHQPARLRERRAVKAHTVADRDQFLRRIARIFPASTTDVDAEFLLQRGQPALERADDARGDAGGMPVHPHHGAERLEPEWMSETPQQLVASVMMDDRLAHDRT